MAFETDPSGNLSFEDLMTKGYFPDRVIPPVNSTGLLTGLAEIRDHLQPITERMLKKKKGTPRSRCVAHSVPKRKHLRRSLSIPNPLHQCMVAAELTEQWRQIRQFCQQSTLSLSVPTIGVGRALIATDDLSSQPFFRAQRSVGARYMLKTDIARFYPSIYTHSIPWALHGKATARADTQFALYGNRLDLWTREQQDKQTGGIPIGPDTSFVIGEIIATALDVELQRKVPGVRGTRSIDDYFLYFNTVTEAETGLATLHGIARQYELEMNDPKTEIISLPDPFEPAWKTDLRSLAIRASGQAQATDLLSLFDRAYENARRYPSDSVLTYAAKQVLGADIAEENWVFCEALLLRAALSEPTMLSVLGDIYDRFAAFCTDNQALTATLESICSYHAPLQHGNEVSWALWLAKSMSVTISTAVADKIAEVDDDIVALIALDLREQGYLQSDNLALWCSYMTKSNLYEDHWLLAYEAREHDWLPSTGNYVMDDDFFSILQRHGIRFYGDSLASTSSSYGYSDDNSLEDPT